MLIAAQVVAVAVCPQPVLELVRHALADERGSEHGAWFARGRGKYLTLRLQITFSGLCLVGFNFLTMLYYDPQYLTMKEGGNVPPNWIYFTCVARPASERGN